MSVEQLEDRCVPATYPLTAVPRLSSLPGAKGTLYLDFNGDFIPSWLSYRNISVPAYDTDGNPRTFSDSELDDIRLIWQMVAEDFAPFQVNVTTVAPPAGKRGVSEIEVGGDGSWYPKDAGGVGELGGWTARSTSRTRGFAFSDLPGVTPQWLADTISHEAGHTAGLEHQSSWSGHTLAEEYQTGPGDGTAPIMGDPPPGTRSLWWYGTNSIRSTRYQNDVKVLFTGFGYRPDDHGNSVRTASRLNVAGTQVTGRGLIGQMSDVDSFSFLTGAGPITLTLNVPFGNNLDARVELRDLKGRLIASDNPSTSFGATISATVPHGWYRLIVAGTGRSPGATGNNFGFNVGSYRITGTILPFTNARPVAVAGPDLSGFEGVAVQFDGAASADADNDALTYLWNFGDGTTGTGPNPKHVYRDDGAYTVTLTVRDNFGASDSDMLRIAVANVAPRAGVSGSGTGAIHLPMPFTLRAFDPSSADRAAGFVYRIDWGDGAVQAVIGNAGQQLAHTYHRLGAFTITVSARDKDGGISSPATFSVQVVPVAQLQAGDLTINGSPGNDRIVITPINLRGTVRVTVNGRRFGQWRPRRQIVVWANAGNDLVRLGTARLYGRRVAVSWPLVILGQAGNDVLDVRSSGQANVLVGGSGLDHLFGGSGRDILLGGLGGDFLLGRAGDDLLVGGTTDHDASPAALLALRAEWARGNLSFFDRVAHLNGQQPGGRNGSYLLDKRTSHSDAAVDNLYGGLGIDWFIAARADRIYDSGAKSISFL